MKKRHFWILIAALLLLDQAVKIFVKTHMTFNEQIAVFGEWFYIRFIENEGAAFGFTLGGEYGKLALSLFRIVAVGAIVWFIGRLFKRGGIPKGVFVGLGLILVGALGNIVDSLFYGLIFSPSGYDTVATLFPAGGGYAGFLHGSVVDMLYFPLIRNAAGEVVFFTPVFNLADSYISIGVIYLLLFQWKFLSKN